LFISYYISLFKHPSLLTTFSKYSQTQSTYALDVNAIGQIIGLYAIYLEIVGGTFVHNITTMKSAIAIFIPIIVLILIGVVLSATILAMIASIGMSSGF